MKVLNVLIFIIYPALLANGSSIQAQDLPDSPSPEFAMFTTHNPKGLTGMVEEADLIAIVRVEEIIEEFDFYGYDTQNIDQYREQERVLQTKLSMPFADYRISILEILKNKSYGHLLASTGSESESIILRKLAIEPSNLGLDMMLFLSMNPDGKTYGVNTFEGQLYLADSGISYYDLQHQKFEAPLFSKDLSVISLSEAIKEFVLTLEDR